MYVATRSWCSIIMYTCNKGVYCVGVPLRNRFSENVFRTQSDIMGCSTCELGAKYCMGPNFKRISHEHNIYMWCYQLDISCARRALYTSVGAFHRMASRGTSGVTS